jgi:arabinogalactan oligomer/maltooligosaccharide transport system permease protein
MVARHTTRAGMAGILSALLPGLGQLYNRQWAKGVAFLAATAMLVAVFVNAIGLQQLETISQTGIIPSDTSGSLLLISSLLLGIAVAVWSIADAARFAKRSRA